MTQEYDNAFVENTQGETEAESHDLTLELKSFLECLSSIVLRQLHVESPAESVSSARTASEAA